MTINKNHHSVQYGVWPDCTNNCDFCLRLNRKPYTKQEKIDWLNRINTNIKTIDWENNFAYGISLLGGELYYIRDKEIQDTFINLIDTIIEYILIPLDQARYSTVTNGIYKPDFLYRVVDHIKDRVGIEKVDMNFSYDLKYRYKTEKSRLLAFNNINNFRKRYNYGVGVQMILTQNVINLWKAGQFDSKEFIETNFPGCHLAFLYPHPIHTKKAKLLPDFNFSRLDFIKYIQHLKNSDYSTYINFIYSTKNSGTFKYTGLNNRRVSKLDLNQQPCLADGKEVISSDCGHSTLYRCYSDSNKCILCDLKLIDPDL